MRKKALDKKLQRIIVSAVVWLIAAAIYGISSLLGIDIQISTVPESRPPVSSNASAALTSESMVKVIDVGQGCSVLVKTAGENTKSILIDAGETHAGDAVCQAIKSAGISSLDLFIISHPHTDHYGGAIDVLKQFKVSELWLPDVDEDLTPTNSTYEKFLSAIEKNGCRVVLKSKAEKLKLGGNATLSIVDGFVDSPSDLNNTSLCIRLDIGEASFLMTGDAETELEKLMINNNANIDADILVAGHHGSNSSSSQKFLNVVTPTASVIPVGKDNDYGHPHKEPLERVKNYTNDIYRTDICGSIVVSSDGEKLDINYENQ